jgi:predicted HicB family RNase H-like nuclease
MVGVMTPEKINVDGVLDPEEVGRIVEAALKPWRESAARIGPVPNQPKTPQRTVRVPDDVWERAKVRAEARGETVSDVVRRALERYGRAK